MLVVTNRIFVNPEFATPFEERFLTRSGMVDEMPGFISNQVLRPLNAGDPYVILTLWESREAFDGWTKSDAFVKGHARSSTLPREAFTAQNKVEIFEVISDTSRPDLKPESHGGPIAAH
jgi:heme oxygenase (mycobilin-producing)